MKITSSRSPRSSRAAAGAWCLVLFAAGLEICWAFALTEAEGFAHPGWAFIGFALAIASLVMLTLALRILPLATAYTAWIGVGAVGVALTGVLVLGEPLTLPRATYLTLILAGVIGLTVVDAPSRSSRTGPEVDERAADEAGER